MADRICSIEDCERPVRARGWCNLHYRRWERTGDPTKILRPVVAGPCSIDGCNSPMRSKGWCENHYQCWRRNGDPEGWVKVRGECSIGGCGGPHAARGWCSRHYKQWLATGDPIPPGPVERFCQKVIFTSCGCCWLWDGATSGGYGSLGFDGEQWKAHRYAWTLTHGPIPDGLDIDHLCFNRSCVNPAHMRLVTRAQNASRKRVSGYSIFEV